MTYLKTLSLTILVLLSLNILAQTFEEVAVPFLSTTPTASRCANFVDVNDDGYDDIFITNGPFSGQNNNLFINDQQGSFTQVMSGDIVSDGDRSDGASFADADNDGDLDVVVVTYGRNGIPRLNFFYRNMGNGQFTYEADNAICQTGTYSEMTNWIDANGDQWLDVLVTNSLINRRNPYFENQGDGTFAENTNYSFTTPAGTSRSVDYVDYNNDNLPDIFITNESNQKNELYSNNGDGTFEQITDVEIVSRFNNAAGSSWGDIDNDGDFDLFIATYSNSGSKNNIFINNGDGTFTEDINSIVNFPSVNSFGSSFADIDNDGDLDLFVCNAYLASLEKNYLYINDGDGNFSLSQGNDLANYSGHTFGCAFGDYNQDGYLDIVLANTIGESQVNALFKNTTSGNNFIQLNLIGTASNYSAIGARVNISAMIDGQAVNQSRFVSGASGYCSQSSYTVHFGLGDADEVTEVEVIWPSGEVDVFTNVEASKRYTITESEGISSNKSQERIFKKLEIIPNPARTSILVQLDESPELVVELLNMKGQRVYRQTWDKKPITVASLPNGKYIVNLLDSTNIVAQGMFTKY